VCLCVCVCVCVGYSGDIVCVGIVGAVTYATHAASREAQ